MMNHIDKILEKIEKEEIKPIPKWYFITKNKLFWLLFLLMTLLGSIAFSIILFSLQQSDFLLLSHLKHSKIETFFSLLPYFWLTSLFVFMVLGFFSFKNFKKSYKYPFWKIAEINILFSSILGTLLFLSNGASFFEQKFADGVAAYNSIEQQKIQHWMQPDKGFLAGIITESKPDTLLINDFNNKQWQVYYHNIFIPPVLNLEKNTKVKLIGKTLNNNTFEAFEIRPWRAFENKNEKKRRNNERN